MIKGIKNLILCAFLALGTSAGAAEYDYLLIHQSDGTETTLTATGLKILFSDGTLLATSGNETASIDLTSIGYLQFTNTAVTGIESVKSQETADGLATVYSISGTVVKTAKASDGTEQWSEGLKAGVYIVIVGGKTSKVIVK